MTDKNTSPHITSQRIISRYIVTALLSLMLMMSLLISQGASSAYAADGSDKPDPKAIAALLIDVDSGKVLYEKNSKQEVYPASLTKMMTGILVLEKLDLDKEVTIPAEAVFPTGNNIKLKEGEKTTVRVLLNALMVYSANDAALALAIEASGSVENFVKEMNAKAKEIGCTHTNYINPNGFTNDPIHHTTCRDLAKIAAYGLEKKEFRKIVKQPEYTVPADNKNGERKVKSTNLMLRKGKYHYDGTIGVKTGFMAISGYCFVGAAKKNGMTLIGMSMNSGLNRRFVEVSEMFDYAAANYKSHKLIGRNESTGTIKVKYGHNTFVDTVAPEGAFVTMPKNGDESLADSKVVIKDHVEAPIKKGTKVGVVKIYEDGKKVGESDVVISKTVEKGGPWAALYISDMAFYISAGVLLLIILVIIIMVSRKKKAKRRREEMRKRERERKAMEIAMEREDKRRRGWPY